MSQIEVITAGARTMVQDSGFSNAREQGVPAGGVLDRAALRFVNALLGNPPETEALEVALVSPALRAVEGPVRLALSGTLQGVVRAPDGAERPVAPWSATTIATDHTLILSAPERGGIGLIGVGGGLDLPLVLGSRSTCLKAGFGGNKGRCLQKGDILPLRGDAPAQPGQDMGFATVPVSRTGPIRVVKGPQEEWFDPADYARFLEAPYRITPKYDRMGMRLDGVRMMFSAGKTADIISDGVAPGAIQVPANGLPIILLADAQTTGGYPKIATVISTDLPRLSNLMPGDALQFQAVSVAEAEAIARAEHAAQAAVIDTIASVRTASPDGAALHRKNLIGGTVDMGKPDHFPGHLFETE